MHTIRKRSGTEAKFQRDKIVNTTRGAGISRETAELVAGDIKHHDGMTKTELRGRVIGAIKNKEPQAAKRYESYPRKVHKTYIWNRNRQVGI